ncbi:Guanine nucleotide exchange factor lte1 [Lobulomyces angularis]|nr:Guanine nucleotide exchange factor lte1 [Lobulomyces angularis]
MLGNYYQDTKLIKSDQDSNRCYSLLLPSLDKIASNNVKPFSKKSIRSKPSEITASTAENKIDKNTRPNENALKTASSKTSRYINRDSIKSYFSCTDELSKIEGKLVIDLDEQFTEFSKIDVILKEKNIDIDGKGKILLLDEYQNKVLKSEVEFLAGTVDKLSNWLISTEDSSFIEDFLLTFRYFLSPSVLGEILVSNLNLKENSATLYCTKDSIFEHYLEEDSKAEGTKNNECSNNCSNGNGVTPNSVDLMLLRDMEKKKLAGFRKRTLKLLGRWSLSWSEDILNFPSLFQLLKNSLTSLQKELEFTSENTVKEDNLIKAILNNLKYEEPKLLNQQKSLLKFEEVEADLLDFYSTFSRKEVAPKKNTTFYNMHGFDSQVTCKSVTSSGPSNFSASSSLNVSFDFSNNAKGVILPNLNEKDTQIHDPSLSKVYVKDIHPETKVNETLKCSSGKYSSSAQIKKMKKSLFSNLLKTRDTSAGSNEDIIKVEEEKLKRENKRQFYRSSVVNHPVVKSTISQKELENGKKVREELQNPQPVPAKNLLAVVTKPPPPKVNTKPLSGEPTKHSKDELQILKSITTTSDNFENLRKSLVLNYPPSLIAKKLYLLELKTFNKLKLQDFLKVESWSHQNFIINFEGEGKRSCINFWREYLEKVYISDDEFVKVNFERSEGNFCSSTSYFENKTNLIENSANTVSCLIKRFETTFQWVLSEILLTKDLATRIDILDAFILLARSCKELGNYQTLILILLALQHPSVRSLTSTWSGLSDKGWSTIESLEKYALDCSLENKSWKIFDDMEEFLFSEKSKRENKVIIPFIGIYLMNLSIIWKILPSQIRANHFLKKSNSSLKELDQLIYFKKFRLISSNLKKVKKSVDAVNELLKGEDHKEFRSRVLGGVEGDCDSLDVYLSNYGGIKLKNEREWDFISSKLEK